VLNVIEDFEEEFIPDHRELQTTSRRKKEKTSKTTLELRYHGVIYSL
jgi:hypothetical protein